MLLEIPSHTTQSQYSRLWGMDIDFTPLDLCLGVNYRFSTFKEGGRCILDVSFQKGEGLFFHREAQMWLMKNTFWISLLAAGMALLWISLLHNLSPEPVALYSLCLQWWLVTFSVRGLWRIAYLNGHWLQSLGIQKDDLTFYLFITLWNELVNLHHTITSS